jgi:hypothetical protein
VQPSSELANYERVLNRPLSRRAMIGAGASAAAALWMSRLAGVAAWAAPGQTTGVPTPIPGDPALDPFNLWLPFPGLEPSTIFDFKGRVALAVIDGSGTDNEGNTFPYEVDMRFMEGEFVGQDGSLHQGAFGFVWLDIFTDHPGGDQIHDFNPGIIPCPDGLFWTEEFPADTVGAAHGAATMRRFDMALRDTFTVGQALACEEGVPAHASFQVDWTRTGALQTLVKPDPVERFRLRFAEAEAHIEWRASHDDGSFSYQADPAATSTTVFAIIGEEQNGVFF